MRILVVEDERALCETIVRSLRRLAYSVDPCYDGDTAIDLLGSERYDLVLLDQHPRLPVGLAKGTEHRHAVRSRQVQIQQHQIVAL